MPHVESIYSSLGADPVLGELVEVFVDEIPSRINTLVSQAAAAGAQQNTNTLEFSLHA